MITCICEHSINLSLLKKGGWVIDFGSGVDFGFSKMMVQYGMKVLAVDPNPLIKEVPKDNNLYFENKALVVDDDISEIEFKIYSDTDAFSSLQTDNDVSFVSVKGSIVVKTITLKSLMNKYNIEEIEVIKLDIEGGEYNFLMNIDRPISKQISIEYHDFRGMNPYFPNNFKFHKLIKEKLHFYDFVKYDIEQHKGIGGKQGLNYWDCLLVKK